MDGKSMKKFNSLALVTVVGYVLTGCSVQQMITLSQVAPNAQQSPGTQVAQQSPGTQVAQQSQGTQVAQQVPSASDIKPIVNMPKAVTVQPKPAVVKAKVRMAKARPTALKRTAAVKPPVTKVTKYPVTKPRVTPAAPKVQAVKKPRVTPAAPKVKTVKKPTPKPAVSQAPWSRRQRSLSLIPSWQMGGRAALRFKSNAWTFGLNWIQRNKQQFSLQIRNPITGTVVGLLNQSPGKATLKSRGKVSSGPDAERLLHQQLGVKMQVNGMPYWIRGVMAPQYPVGKVTLDAKGRPKQIVQAGWVMDYFNYANLSFDAMPRKVNISRKPEQINVRILAKQWKAP